MTTTNMLLWLLSIGMLALGVVVACMMTFAIEDSLTRFLIVVMLISGTARAVRYLNRTFGIVIE